MRQTSVSLPTTKPAIDLHEKPDRYGRREPGFFSRLRIAWMSQSQKARWAKTAAVVFALVALFYFFSSTPRGAEFYKEVAHHNPLAHDIPPPANNPQPPPPPNKPPKPEPPKNGPPKNDEKQQRPQPPQKGPTKNNGNPPSGPGDGQPSGHPPTTDRCSVPHSKNKPVLQYVLMIDAGSTGSRIHVYRFNNCGATPELEGEEFMMTERAAGGLSAYKDDPDAAAHSLDGLMDLAMRTVPEKLRSCSPVAVKATAGLRMVGDDASKAILAAVRRHLEKDFPFPVVSDDNDGVVVMEGKMEGVYAWVTTNYLLGKVGGPDKSPTAAVFDLGGGSTQIVFEPTFAGLPSGGMPGKLAAGDHKYEMEFDGSRFELYQHSHLGYGLVAASKSIHRTLVDSVAAGKSGTEWASAPVVHPCLPPLTTAEVEVEFDDGGDGKAEPHPLGPKHKFTMTGPSSPAPAQCRALADKILRKDAECNLAPCSFNGVHQPSLAKSFAREDVYIFSFFYDRTKPLGMPDSFTLREMHDLANTVCGGEPAWDVFSTVPGALDELRKNPMWCLELNFMVSLLHTGYDMPIEREVRIAKKIKGNELGWCLGASLPLLPSDSGWTCKIKEVA